MEPLLVIHPSGTVFWVETDWKEFTLVAANRDGILFRSPFSIEGNPNWVRSLLTVDDLVVANIDAEILGFSAADGTVLWRASILAAHQLADCSEFPVDRRAFMAVDHEGRLIVAGSCRRQDGLGHLALIQVIDRDGSITESFPESYSVGGLFVDRNGRRYVVGGGSFRVVGDPAYRIDFTGGFGPSFTTSGKTLLPNCEIIDLMDGSLQPSPVIPWPCFFVAPPIARDGVGILSGGGRMVGFQLSTGSNLWELQFPVARWMNSSGGVVTQRRSVAAIHGGQEYIDQVFKNIFAEVSLSGAPLRSCELDGRSTMNQAIAIHDGALWAVGATIETNSRYPGRVFAIRLPGATESEVGWPTKYGGKEGHRRDR